MGTFAQWVKTQEDRQDAIGYFARYWASVTPGKISSPDGIAKHLDRIAKSYADGGDERGKAAIAAAQSGYHLAVKEYHQARTREQAESQGLVVHVPDEVPPVTDAEPQEPDDGAGNDISPEALARSVEQRFETVRDEHGPKIVEKRAPELPSSRLASLEARLAVSETLQAEFNAALSRVEDKLDAILDALYPEPIDWSAIYASADHGTGQ